jgi:hypothetical protein
MIDEKTYLHRLRQCVRPVVFITGIDEAPYGMKGTAFIVGHSGRVFVVTAEHVVRNLPIESIAIFPHKSRTPFVFGDGCKFDSGGDEDTDQYDWAIVEANAKRLSNTARRKGGVIDLTHPLASDWFDKRYSSDFFALGFPSAVADDLDYSAPKDVNTPQLLLRGKYASLGHGRHVHTLTVDNPLGIRDFDGMSGSPVFSTSGSVTVFCGMVLRGTASSRLMHFVDGNVLLHLIRHAMATSPAPSS